MACGPPYLGSGALAADHQSKPPPDKQAGDDEEAPHRQEEESEDAGVFRLGRQQPFDDADRREQTDRPADAAHDPDDDFLRRHARAYFRSSNSASRQRLAKEITSELPSRNITILSYSSMVSGLNSK